MKIRRDDVCGGCATTIVAGTSAYWLRDSRQVWCLPCHETPDATAPPEEQAGTAGASALAEYHRRSERELARTEKAIKADAEWRDQVVADRPVLGWVARATTPKPTTGPESQATRAWKVGAEGEQRVAEVLADVDGITILHDRAVPGSKANIDHIVVGHAGIYVIDAKKYKGRIEVRDKGGLLSSDRRLYVAGRDRTKLVEAMRWQIDVVENALPPSFAHVPVIGVLCLVAAEWSLIPRPIVLDGVTALWPGRLPKFVTTNTDGVWMDGEAVGQSLAAALPPAG
ncbi:nuclease-related domain-containing protein [Euzebya tangerina]|uniref:nuclease-related domain-containing protein n=1 Tax=Euzebya tangerina TaxID=591198 RepID=UPI0013C3150C|nr:nuclease-related domain-containing protein [Euzebya tangerina]